MEEPLEFVPLTPIQKQSFEEDGFLVVRNAIDRDRLDDLVASGDRLATPFLQKPHITHKPWLNDLDLRPGLLQEGAFLSLVSLPATVSLVVQLLGPNIQLHSTALIYKKPEAPDLPPFRRGWHRDLRMAPDLGHADLPRVGIKVCYCLSDFHQPDSGMTLMARGSHRCQTPLAIPAGEIDPLDYEVCDVSLAAGDALLFDNRIYHTATPNRSDRIAKRVIYAYTYRWLKPEVYLESSAVVALEGADAIARQLLGGSGDVDARPWALQDWARYHGVLPESVPWTVTV